MQNQPTPAPLSWEPSDDLKLRQKQSERNMLGSDSEFVKAFDILTKHPKRVTVFGSARNLPTNEHYVQAAYDLSYRLAKDGYSVVTGGGPGIMDSSNKGAFEAGGSSVGFNIKLPHEQNPNPYTTDELTFRYFFTRKVSLTFFSHAYIYFPGGYGTLDELFEVMTLIQTKKMPALKIVLFGKEHWSELDEFIKKHLLATGYISEGDEQIYTITDSIDEAIQIINEPEPEYNKESLFN